MKNMKKLIGLTIASLILSVSGCATIDTLTDNEKNTAYAQYIVDNKLESIDYIKTFNFKGWHPLTNDYLILKSTFNKRFLISLNESCYDLDDTNTITTAQSLIGRLSAKHDAIHVLNGFQSTCYIKSIYPIEKSVVKTLQNIGKSIKGDE